MKSDHLSRVSESLGFSHIKPSLGTPVFSDTCWNCNLWWCLCLSFMVSNDFMATCHKCNQPNHNNFKIQVGCFPLPISEKLFLRISCLFIFWWQRVLCVKTQVVAWGELAIIFWFQTFNCNTVYSYDGQSNSWRSNKIFI